MNALHCVSYDRSSLKRAGRTSVLSPEIYNAHACIDMIQSQPQERVKSHSRLEATYRSLTLRTAFVGYWSIK